MSLDLLVPLRKYLWLLTATVLILLIVVGIVLFWLAGPTIETARDYEQCIDPSSGAGSVIQSRSLDCDHGLIVSCNARFAGRRRPGGGYTCYDFMQNRSFNIAGPNPSAEERRQIDKEYLKFLDAQREEITSSEVIRRHLDEERAHRFRSSQPVGPPLLLTPRIAAVPVPKRPSDRTKPAHCAQISLDCSWSKFSAAVKQAFGAASNVKR
jgi:hypothetical protein